MDKNLLVAMENIVKIFPPSNIALDSVSVGIKEGEIHSIIGENGAGKSTLMKALYGLEKPNSGTISIKGKKVSFNSPEDAVSQGIGMVHQEFMLIYNYSVLENIILGHEPVNKTKLINYDEAKKKYLKVIDGIGFNIEPDQKVGELSVAIQQKIEIVKQLYRDVNILILDEPTAVLAPQEVKEFFKTIRKLRDQGKTIIFISHKLDEILDISDTITVMRQGKHIWTKKNINLTKQNLAEAMVGRTVMFAVNKTEIEREHIVLKLQDLTVNSKIHPKKKLLDHISLNVHSKEIVGIAGVEGNGQYELVQAITGQIQLNSGKIFVNKEDITEKNIRYRRKNIAYISQDRKTQGSSQSDSLVENSFMTHHYLNTKLVGKWNLLSSKAINHFTQSIIDNFSVVCSSKNVPISSLSGGNQQKIIVGREFELNNPLLVLDQPVRGLDVGSIEYIQRRVIEQRDKGTAVLLVSADLDELFALSDRIVVMYNGRINTIKKPVETSKIEIGEYMLGSKGGEQ